MKETSHVTSSGVLELGQAADVDPFEHGHSIVGTQAFVQLPVADVERDHVRRAVLQQAVREAAGRGADIEATEPSTGTASDSSACSSFLAAAGDVARRPLDDELGVLVDLLARLA